MTCSHPAPGLTWDPSLAALRRRITSGAKVFFGGVAFIFVTEATAETVPSGQPLILHQELVEDRADAWFLYLGYHTPDLAAQKASRGLIGLEQDLDAICETVLPRRESIGDPWEGITELTVRFMAKPLNFGQSDASVAQVMGFYDLSEGDCAWL